MNDCTRFKGMKFVKKKSDTTAALLSLIVGYITPQQLSIKCVRTDNGGEFVSRIFMSDSKFFFSV